MSIVKSEFDMSKQPMEIRMQIPVGMEIQVGERFVITFPAIAEARMFIVTEIDAGWLTGREVEDSND